MPYSITCSTKILALAITPLMFISVGIPCEFAMVCTFYCPPPAGRGALFFLRGHMYTFGNRFSKKI